MGAMLEHAFMQHAVLAGLCAGVICAQFAPSHSHVWLLGSAIEIWLVMPPNNTVRPRAKSFAGTNRTWS